MNGYAAAARSARSTMTRIFEVHSLDIVLATAVHVRAREPLPDGLERARTLALHPQYLFVEVYPQSMRAVRADGSVNVVTTP